MSYPLIDAITGSQIIVNGQLMAVSAKEAAGFFQPYDRQMFYEVVRITRKVPLFLEDHLARLERSVNGLWPIPHQLAKLSDRLIKANGLSEANLRLVLTGDDLVLHLTPSYYPDQRQFKDGVATSVLAWERKQPNVKSIDPAYKAAVAEGFAKEGPYGRPFELLLKDKKGYLTEGSRSNLFFIKDDIIISAPDDKILLGITRRIVNEAIDSAGLSLKTDLLTLDQVLSDSSIGAFISGSPIDLLPVSSIDGHKLSSVNQVFERLNRAYHAVVDAYIEQYRLNNQ